jgi:hypothetical protein
MMERKRLGELIVPAIVLVGCLLYWLHIYDARSVAQRVPNGVILFTVAMSFLVLLLEYARPSPIMLDEHSLRQTELDVILKRTAFVGLCIGYFVAFTTVGFNIANLTFLIVAYALAGMKPLSALFTAIVSTLVFHALAWVMEFNVPTGPFGL